jgi:6-phospho-beta-glucosidase
MSLNIAVIGAASSYTPELFANLIELNGQLDVERVTLMDLNLEKLTFIAGVCKRLLTEANNSIEVVATQDRHAAITGADFIILQIESQDWLRDEHLPMEFGMVGRDNRAGGSSAPYDCAHCLGD